MKKLLGIFIIIGITCLLSRFALITFQEDLFTEVQTETPSPTIADNELLTVVAYNIHHGTDMFENFRLNEMALLLSDADIIFLSEIDRTFGSRSYYLDQLEEFQNLTGLKHQAYAPTLEKTGLFNIRGTYGIAILSRFPIIDTTIYPLPTIPFDEPRAALKVTVSWGNQILTIWATHLSPVFDTRKQQLEYLSVSAYDADLLLGDLNARPDEINSLKIALALKNTETTPTFPSDNPNAKIDYILYGNRLKLQTAQTIPSLYSDHLPVKASFYLSN